MNNMVHTAYAFATAAHAAVGQTRKYTGDPYIVHPRAVAHLVSCVTEDPEMIAAALLHDVVEDTKVSAYTIRELFGYRVALLVAELTDVSAPEDGNRETRKAIDRAHTASASPAAKTIKLADLIDNTRSIVKHDKEFARVYLAEKALLLEVLTEGDSRLWAHAKQQLTEALKEL